MPGPSEGGVVHRWPVGVDPNLITGHRSIVEHTCRLSAAEYLADGRGDNPRYIYKEKRGPWQFYVMSAGCKSSVKKFLPQCNDVYLCMYSYSNEYRSCLSSFESSRASLKESAIAHIFHGFTMTAAEND